MKHKYGEFTESQVAVTKQSMRKQIYFLLLCADPKTKDNYQNVDIDQAFESILTKFGGLNEVLLCPPELVKVLALLEAARIEYSKESFNFAHYRKLILDAGNEVLKIKEVS